MVATGDGELGPSNEESEKYGEAVHIQTWDFFREKDFRVYAEAIMGAAIKKGEPVTIQGESIEDTTMTPEMAYQEILKGGEVGRYFIHDYMQRTGKNLHIRDMEPLVSGYERLYNLTKRFRGRIREIGIVASPEKRLGIKEGDEIVLGAHRGAYLGKISHLFGDEAVINYTLTLLSKTVSTQQVSIKIKEIKPHKMGEDSKMRWEADLPEGL